MANWAYFGPLCQDAGVQLKVAPRDPDHSPWKMGNLCLLLQVPFKKALFVVQATHSLI